MLRILGLQETGFDALWRAYIFALVFFKYSIILEDVQKYVRITTNKLRKVWSRLQLTCVINTRLQPASGSTCMSPSLGHYVGERVHRQHDLAEFVARSSKDLHFFSTIYYLCD